LKLGRLETLEAILDKPDEPDPFSVVRPEVPRFESSMGQWTLSRYADVSAALRETGLCAASARVQGAGGTVDEVAHSQFRELAQVAFSRDKVAEWRAQIAPMADRMFGGLAQNRTIELMSELAEPWSLAVALTVTGADPLLAEQLNHLARDVFKAASEPFDGGLEASAARATAELMGSLSSALSVQAFVALSQTLPCFLSGAWLALLRNPAEMLELRNNLELMPKAVEELLRYSTPSRAQFRRARSTANINGTKIDAGQRVALMLAAANRDPVEFPEPDRLNWRRPRLNHVAFGAGPHACVGAALIRTAAGVATKAFLDYFGETELTDSIHWRGGSSIRWPVSLRVRRPTNTAT
jgi:cytochrome P450